MRALAAVLCITTALALDSPKIEVRAVGPIGMTVADLDASVEFYTRVLQFEKVSQSEMAGGDIEQLEGVFGLRIRRAVLPHGDERIELTEFLTPQGRAIPVDSRSNDHWFQHVAIITSDMDQAYEWLRANKVRHVSPSPQRLPDSNPAAAGIRAFYFKDLDGHSLEVLQFPHGKGAAKWHAAGSLFLGIDHTAIVVGDTAAGLAFYRDVLGMRVAGESENFGPEQERLNNVFGAHLRITSLRAEEGPGVEFLEYLSPTGGRPVPPDERPNDLAHWQTKVIAADAGAACSQLWHARYVFVSAGANAKECLVRDPDGHVLDVAEK